MTLNYFVTAGELFKSCFTYATEGPARKTWGLAQHVHVKVIRSVLRYPKTRDIKKLMKHFYTIREVTEKAVGRSFTALQLSYGKLSHGRLEVPRLDDLLTGVYTDVPLRRCSDALCHVECEWLRLGESGVKDVSQVISPDTKVFLTLHGGAYTLMSPRTHRQMACELAKWNDAIVFSVDYALAPENAFPAALFDAVSTYIYLITKLTIKPSQIIVQGDSAGGGLGFALLLFLRDFGAAIEAGLNLSPGTLSGIKGYIGFSPWLDLTMQAPSIKINSKCDILLDQSGDVFPSWLYVEGEKCFEIAEADKPEFEIKVADIARNNCYISPLYAESFGNLPPIFIICGSAELIVSDSINVYGRMTGLVQKEELVGWKSEWISNTTDEIVNYERPADFRRVGKALKFHSFHDSPSSKIRVDVYQDQIHVFMAFPHVSKRHACYEQIAEWCGSIGWGCESSAPSTDTDQPVINKLKDGLHIVY